MDARTATNNIRLHQPNTLKLHVVQHKYSARIAKHACAVRHHAKTLLRLHDQILLEAVAIACPDYAWFHAAESTAA
jgi:hypothetical protein